MTIEERAKQLGNELTDAVDAYARNPTPEALATMQAALINRCASVSANAVVPVWERLDALAREVEALRRLMLLEDQDGG